MKARERYCVQDYKQETAWTGPCVGPVPLNHADHLAIPAKVPNLKSQNQRPVLGGAQMNYSLHFDTDTSYWDHAGRLVNRQTVTQTLLEA